jgi:hypothetical protein
MSRILIDEEELRTVIKALDFGIVSLLRENKSADYSPLIHAEGLLKSSIVASKKRRFSVLEWHKYADEKPKRKGYYYIKFKDDPRICEILLDENDTILEDGEYWSEPPKFLPE